MNIFISCDMEGIGGVVDWNHVTPGTTEWQRYRRLMTDELLHIINILKMLEIEKIVINEGHSQMSNLLYEEFPFAVHTIQGKVKPLWMMEGLDKSFDAVMFVGYHAAAGTAGAVLDHTFAACELKINGKVIGETGLNGYLAVTLNVPVVFLSGDSAACSEAKALFPQIRTVPTKKGISRYAAECYPKNAIYQMYKEELPKSFELMGKNSSLKLPENFEMELMFPTPEIPDLAILIPGVKRLDGRTIQYSSANYVEVFKVFHLIMALKGFYK